MAGVTRAHCFVSLALVSLAAQPILCAVDFARDVEPILHQRCYLCHGSQQQMSGLRLDSRDAALAGGLSGPAVVPGDPAASALIARVSSDRSGFRMPPGDDVLSGEEVAALRAWIAEGAEWQGTAPLTAESAAAREEVAERHWAFQPIRRPKVPSTAGREWIRSPIDAFVLAKLESEGLAPSGEASATTLLRRLHLDLVGLPPSPEDLRRYLALGSRGYATAVDELINSPHFGERWSLSWLDLARYADSDGYERDPLRPHAWRWRHWVIDAINRDMPFDRFTREQVAGDLLPGAGVEQRVATGFLRNGIKNREAGTKNAQKRFEETIDRVNTVANTWLGLTVGCAQCHDHKYDPLSQREFYGMFAFFHNTVERDVDAPLSVDPPTGVQSVNTFRAAAQQVREAHGLPSLQSEWRQNMVAAMDDPGRRTDWDHSVTEWRAANDRADWLMRSPADELTVIERQKVDDWFLSRSGPDFAKNEAVMDRLKAARKEIDGLRKQAEDTPRAYTMVERRRPVPARLALRGDYRALGSEVAPHLPAVLPSLPAEAKPTRRLFAEWLVSPDNPLTARVEVNRIWQELFGRGLVSTPDNFGTQGDPPSHPGLLDWLASEFVDHGWSRKAMVRGIVMSATYRQSSDARPDAEESDPGNAWLVRQNRLRLPAELIRDNALAASGLLHRRVGGKSVFPPQPSGVAELSYSKKDWVEDEGADRHRRGLYVFLRRTSPYPMLVNFDAPDTLTSVSRRERSNTPLQALNLLNDPAFQEASTALADLAMQDSGAEFGARFSRLALRCLGREPVDQETQAAERFHAAQMERFGVRGGDAERQAWREVGRALLSLDEFVTRE